MLIFRAMFATDFRRLQHAAARIRGHWAGLANAALANLGPEPAYVTPTEAEVRSWLHDEVSDHHDRDFFSLLAFGLPEDLQPDFPLVIPDGRQAKLDSFFRSTATAGKLAPRALLCMNGHAKLILPKGASVSTPFTSRAFQCSSVDDILLNAAHEQPTVATAKLPPCNHCKVPRGRAGTVPIAARYALIEQYGGGR